MCLIYFYNSLHYLLFIYEYIKKNIFLSIIPYFINIYKTIRKHRSFVNLLPQAQLVRYVSLLMAAASNVEDAITDTFSYSQYAKKKSS